MEYDPTRMCELLVGLGDVEVLSVDDEGGGPLRVHVRCRAARPACGGCGQRLWSDGERAVVLVDLPAFGRPVLPAPQSNTHGTSAGGAAHAMAVRRAQSPSRRRRSRRRGRF